VLGVCCGFLVHRLSLFALARGSLKRRHVASYFIEGVGAVPGILIVIQRDSGDFPSSNLLTMLWPMAAYILPYAAARIGTQVVSARRGHRRENALPFEHWFALLRSDPEAAGAYITNLFKHLESQRRRVRQPNIGQVHAVSTEQLVELRGVRGALLEAHASDPLLREALKTLDAQIDRITAESAQLAAHSS